MTKVGELYAEVKVQGAKEAAKSVENLSRDFGFLGNAAAGAMKILEWGAQTLNEGIQMSQAYARQMDIMTFRNKIGAESFQRLDQAFRQHGGRVEDFISVYDDLQTRQARWRKFGMSENEGLAFGLLGINPADYNDVLDLMDVITQKLIKMENIGDRNMIAGILGINDELLRIASKGDYIIYNNIVMTEEQKQIINEQQQQLETLGILWDGLKVKLGTKWKADWGIDISKSLVSVTQDMVNATDAADGFFSALYGIGAAALSGIGNKNGNRTERNWWGKFVDTLDDGMVVIGDLMSGKTDMGELYADILKNDQIRTELRKHSQQAIKQETTTASGNPQGSMTNGAYVLQRLMDAGYSREFAAAMLGHFERESNVDPTQVGDKGTSFGIAQWHNNRAKGLPKDLEGQVDFLINELANDFGMTPERANKMSYAQASHWGLYTFENPAQKDKEAPIRYNKGLKYLGRYGTFGENMSMSEATRQMTVNNTANVTINADSVDSNLLQRTINKQIEQGMNETSMSINGGK